MIRLTRAANDLGEQAVSKRFNPSRVFKSDPMMDKQGRLVGDLYRWLIVKVDGRH